MCAAELGQTITGAMDAGDYILIEAAVTECSDRCPTYTNTLATSWRIFMLESLTAR